jgi:elongation factor Ts
MDNIKKLRELTGSSIALCKKALEESGGDFSKALEILGKSIEAVADKKSGRVAGVGIVDAYVHGNGKIGVLLELKTETDFVARNDAFKNLAHELSLHIAAMNPPDVATLLSQSFVKDLAITTEELIKRHSGTFGEKIEVARFSRFEL